MTSCEQTKMADLELTATVQKALPIKIDIRDGIAMVC